MRRRVAILAVLGSGLGLGATALAQGGGGHRRLIELDRGCLAGTRVTVRIVPAKGESLSPVHIRAGSREVVHLTGVTQRASVIVRLPHEGRVSVAGVSSGGEHFSTARNYRRCAPAHPPRNAAPVTGGGEG